jgi:hypothetical protein
VQQGFADGNRKKQPADPKRERERNRETEERRGERRGDRERLVHQGSEANERRLQRSKERVFIRKRRDRN